MAGQPVKIKPGGQVEREMGGVGRKSTVPKEVLCLKKYCADIGLIRL